MSSIMYHDYRSGGPVPMVGRGTLRLRLFGKTPSRSSKSCERYRGIMARQLRRASGSFPSPAPIRQLDLINGHDNSPCSLPSKPSTTKLSSPIESQSHHNTYDTILNNPEFMSTMTAVSPENSVKSETCAKTRNNLDTLRGGENGTTLNYDALTSADIQGSHGSGLPPANITGASSPSSFPRLTPHSRGASPKRKRLALEVIISSGTVANERYSLTVPLHYPDHENDDRHFIVDRASGNRVFAVFDGHDGYRASELSMYYMKRKFEKIIESKIESADDALEQIFIGAENHFFKQISGAIYEKTAIQGQLPPGISSYDAYLRYPDEVSRLQELESSLSGGTTATVAMIYNGQLHVANAGDTRAILVSKEAAADGGYAFDQLSTDHTVNNPDELERLTNFCGLDGEVLTKNGRLGSQENTRSIGDYNIKEAGYRDVDTLCMAITPPGIAIPTISAPVTLTAEHVYLIVMTDGVYKSIEQYTDDPSHVNLILMKFVEMAEAESRGQYQEVVPLLLKRIKMEHERIYRINAKKDQRSHLAVQCRKRDDMTMTLCKFT